MKTAVISFGEINKNVSMFDYNEDLYLELTCDDPSCGLRGVEQVGGGRIRRRVVGR